MSSGGNAPSQMQADPNAITLADMVDTPYGSVNRSQYNQMYGYGNAMRFPNSQPGPQASFGGYGGYQQPRWGGSMGYGGYSPYMGGYGMGGYGGGFGGFGGGYGMGGYGGGFGSPFGMGGFGGGYGMGGYGMGGYGMGGYGRPFNLGGGQYSPYMGGYGMGGYPPSSWYAQQNHAQANGGTNLLPINESGHPIFGTTFS